MTHSTHVIYDYMEGRKEVFYLTMHSFNLVIWMDGRMERIVLFNDALNTFYLRLYGEQQGFFYMHHPTNRRTLVMEH